MEPTIDGDPVEQATDTPLYRLLGETLRANDPEGIPIPIMAPFATDARHFADRRPTRSVRAVRTNLGLVLTGIDVVLGRS